MYKLRSTLKGHELDVRGVTSISDSQLISASRDGTGRLWNLSFTLDTVNDNTICFLSPTSSFINSVAYIPDTPDQPLVAFGGKDQIIYLCHPIESFAKPGDDSGAFQLVGHTSNVCSLNYKNMQLISGSWDCTAKVWDLHSYAIKHDLIGHSAAVWDAKVVDADEQIYLTCSADQTIRKWKKSREIACFRAHNDVVRKLFVLPGAKEFVSASNDGTLKIWDLETGNVLQTLIGHTSFVYDIALTSNGDIVSTAEDRSVRIWRNGKIHQVITIPCLSAWCVCVLPNDDIAVGGSGKEIYVFTTDSERFATLQGQQAFTELVQLSTISEQSIDDLKKTDLPGYDRLSLPGKEEGAVIMVKNPTGAIEAHQWSGGQWVKIGDVVGSAGGSSDKKEYNGESYDFVFDVDIEDGKPPLKLPYNVNENPYTAAERFLAANDLPSSYTEEVVRFLQENTKGFSLDQQTQPEQPKPELAANPTTPKPNSLSNSIFPQKTYIKFTDYKSDVLFKGFEKLNLAQTPEAAFSSGEIRDVKAALENLTSAKASFLISKVIPRILSHWSKSSKLIGYDFLRVCIPRITIADIIKSTECGEALLPAVLSSLEEVEESDLAVVMMISKALCNLVTSPLFAQMFLTVTDTGSVSLNEHFETLGQNIVVVVKVFTSSSVSRSHKHFSTAMSSIASFLYNLLVYVFTNRTLGADADALRSIASVVNELGEDFVGADEESTYRLCVTLGNLLTGGISTELPSWFEEAAKKYSGSRFSDLYKDIRGISVK